MPIFFRKLLETLTVNQCQELWDWFDGEPVAVDEVMVELESVLELHNRIAQIVQNEDKEKS